MIEDSLLFQMGYIFPDIAIFDVVISFIFFLSVFVFLRLREKILTRSPRPTLPLLPKLDDAHFEEKLAEYIRATFALTYVPLRSRAHTAREIAQYAGDHPFISILRDLEKREYQSSPLSEAERKIFLEAIKKE